jgi:hypothetical protein
LCGWGQSLAWLIQQFVMTFSTILNVFLSQFHTRFSVSVLVFNVCTSPPGIDRLVG